MDDVVVATVVDQEGDLPNRRRVEGEEKGVDSSAAGRLVAVRCGVAVRRGVAEQGREWSSAGRLGERGGEWGNFGREGEGTPRVSGRGSGGCRCTKIGVP